MAALIALSMALALPVGAWAVEEGMEDAAPEVIEDQVEEAVVDETPKDTEEGIMVVYEAGRLSVLLKQAPLGLVLDQIARSAGIGLVMQSDQGAALISTKFTDLPLEQGLQRVLRMAGIRDYIVDYNKDGSIKSLKIMMANPSVIQTPKAPVSNPGARPKSPMQRTTPTRASPRPGASANTAPNLQQPPFVPYREMDAPPPMEGQDAAPYVPPAQPPSYIPPRR